MNERVTLMEPDARDPTARAISSGFPLDLPRQSAGRLRVLALLYAPARVVYSLTKYGRSLLPIAESVRRWERGHIERFGA
jgi:hypothetical protein